MKSVNGKLSQELSALNAEANSLRNIEKCLFETHQKFYSVHRNDMKKLKDDKYVLRVKLFNIMAQNKQGVPLIFVLISSVKELIKFLWPHLWAIASISCSTMQHECFS